MLTISLNKAVRIVSFFAFITPPTGRDQIEPTDGQLTEFAFIPEMIQVSNSQNTAHRAPFYIKEQVTANIRQDIFAIGFAILLLNNVLFRL